MNGNNSDNKSNGSSDLDRILNESANSIFEGTRSVTNSSSSAPAGDPTVEKAKTEIGAQADSMLREIEERRQRRAARQRELDQQVQIEAEAKARRQARLKAQEEMEAKIRDASAKNSADGRALGSKPQPKNITDDTMKHFSDAPPSSRASQKREQQSDRARERRSISSGETQIMPKISETTSSSVRHRTHADQPKRDNNTKHQHSAAARNNRPAAVQRSASHSAPAKVSSERKTTGKTKEVDKMKELRDWAIAIVIAVVVSLLIRNFVFTLVKVQGESMQPTLQNEDRLYVNRFFYSPEKGDVIIFKPESDPNRPYIKRVIATEGDTVYIDFATGDVYVNDILLDEPYIKDKTTRSGEYINSLISSGNYSKDNPIVVEKDHVFVMGDNRNNSKDSRMIGQIPKDEYLGGAVFRFWPLSSFGSVSYDMDYAD